MSISTISARRLAAGAVGATAVAGAMLFGATPPADAAQAPAPQMVGLAHVEPVWWGHHHHHGHHGNNGGRYGGIHIA